jgi:hypothetical protein
MQPGYEQYPPFQHPQKKKRARWPWILLGVGLGLIVLVCAALATLANMAGESLDNQIEHGNTDLAKHVTISSCQRDAMGFVTVNFTVKNTSDSTQSYLMQFDIKNAAGTRIAEAHGIVNNLAPSATAKDSAVGIDSVDKREKFTCVLERVN